MFEPCERFQRHDGNVLKIVLICRQSRDVDVNGSGSDQEGILRGWLAQHVSLPYDVTVVSANDAGRLMPFRHSLKALLESNERGKRDMLVTTSLNRISRQHALQFLQAAVNAGVRIVAVDDKVDTAASDWRQSALLALRRRAS